MSFWLIQRIVKSLWRNNEARALENDYKVYVTYNVSGNRFITSLLLDTNFHLGPVFCEIFDPLQEH